MFVIIERYKNRTSGGRLLGDYYWQFGNITCRKMQQHNLLLVHIRLVSLNSAPRGIKIKYCS